jgi:tetratricopeptide (TPR) repeat protein
MNTKVLLILSFLGLTTLGSGYPALAAEGASTAQLLAEVTPCFRCNAQGVCYECDRGVVNREGIIPRGLVLDQRPNLCWSALAGVTHYRVRLTTGNQTIFDRELDLSNTPDARDPIIKFPYPQDVASLRFNQDYQLMIQGGYFQEEAPLLLTDPSGIQSLQEAIRAIQNQPLSSAEQQLALAQIYRDHQFFTAALETLKAIPKEAQNTEALLLLGDLYLGFNQVEASDFYYHKASDRAIENHDLAGQWEAAFGQARIQIALGQFDTAIATLKTIYTQTESDPKALEKSAESAAVLGQVYRLTGNPTQARLWYIQAKSKYQQLQDDRVILMEEELNALPGEEING